MPKTSLRFRNWLACCLTFLMIAVFSNSLQAQDIQTREPTAADGKLEWQYSAGRVFKMKMEQDIKITLTQGANAMPGSTTRSVTEMTTRVESVDDEGVASATCKLDRMIASTTAGNVKMLFDSASDAKLEGFSAEIGKILTPMIGKPMTQKMAPSGKVFDVQVPEEMLDGIKNANPIFASMFNKQTIEEMSANGAVDFPSTNPAVGEKWEVVSEIKSGAAPVTTKNQYEYLGVAEIDGQPLHVLKVNISMSFPNGISGMPVDITAESSHGYFYFDGVNGMIKKSSVDQDVTMQFGGAIVQNLKQIMTMELTTPEKE